LPELDKSILAILEKYKAALYTRDVAALMRLYDPKVRVFDTWGVWSYEGATKWQVAVEGLFAAHAEERIKATFEDVQCAGSPEVAIVSAIITTQWLSAQGAALRSLQNRITWGLKTSGHVLRIVHEHSSAPIGYEDNQAIFLRPAAR
jgi:ketosteroid isomerase-like protein